jgi:hypothetical protein
MMNDEKNDLTRRGGRPLYFQYFTWKNFHLDEISIGLNFTWTKFHLDVKTMFILTKYEFLWLFREFEIASFTKFLDTQKNILTIIYLIEIFFLTPFFFTSK